MEKQLEIVIKKTGGDLSTRVYGRIGEVIQASVLLLAQMFLQRRKSESSAEKFAADIAEYLVQTIKKEAENAEG